MTMGKLSNWLRMQVGNPLRSTALAGTIWFTDEGTGSVNRIRK